MMLYLVCFLICLRRNSLRHRLLAELLLTFGRSEEAFADLVSIRSSNLKKHIADTQCGWGTASSLVKFERI